MTQASQLEQWIAQEEDVLGRMHAGAGAGVSRPDQVAGKSGMEMMQAMLRREPYKLKG